MTNRIHGSFTELMLLKLYGLLARRLDVHRGAPGALYRRAYFLYKTIKDQPVIRAARRLARPGTVVVDVGANIGFFSLTLSRHGDVRVLAFEPDEKNFQQLSMLIRDAGLTTRVFAYPLALSASTGTAKLYLSDLAPTDHKLINTRSTATVDVATTRLDDFMASHPEHAGRRISLVKIDVQGAELLVLEGMHQTLAVHCYPPILIEYSPMDLQAAGVGPLDFFEAFAKLSYRPHLLGESDASEPSDIIASTQAYTNLLMVAGSSRGA